MSIEFYNIVFANGHYIEITANEFTSIDKNNVVYIAKCIKGVKNTLVLYTNEYLMSAEKYIKNYTTLTMYEVFKLNDFDKALIREFNT